MLEIAQAEHFVATLADARLRGDVDALVECFHADAVLRIIGWGEPAAGKPAIGAMLRELVGAFEFVEWQPLKTFADNDDIVVRQKLKVRYHATGKTADTETCEFLTVKDGLCTSYVQFADTALIQSLTNHG